MCHPIRTLLSIIFPSVIVITSCATVPPELATPAAVESQAAIPTQTEPATVPHSYVISDTPTLNPERGFLTPYELPGPEDFRYVRGSGNTLVHIYIRLDNWRETDIPQDVLDDLDNDFSDMRDAGIKAIIRFAYNSGPYPLSEPDASKAQALRHIEQFNTFLHRNADVIAWVEAGFIGAWGEWHTSTNELDNPTDKRDILFALLKALPQTRMVQVRYPADIIQIFPHVLTESQAFSKIDQARIAHHNDCFLSSDTDMGTYYPKGTNTFDRDIAYLAELTRFTPMSGETCAPNPPRSACESALKEMALLHFSAINGTFHPDILSEWKDGGCYDEINNRLGYRIFLTIADFNEQVRPGGILNLTVHIRNTGFASIINERPLYVVLSSASTLNEGQYRALLPVDPRHWEPGETLLNIKLHVPFTATEGRYRLALWLPDEYGSLRDNPLYAIRFANDNIWDEVTGFNVLGNVTITESAGGESEHGDNFTVILAETRTARDIPLSVSAILPTPTAELLTPESITSELITNSKIESLADNTSVLFKFFGDVVSYNSFQVFLDTDQNPFTGYSIQGIGADFLLENDTLNAYAGGGRDWVWKSVQVEMFFSNYGQVAKWILPRSALGNSKIIDAVFQLSDVNWRSAFVTSKQTYLLK